MGMPAVRVPANVQVRARDSESAVVELERRKEIKFILEINKQDLITDG